MPLVTRFSQGNAHEQGQRQAEPNGLRASHTPVALWTPHYPHYPTTPPPRPHRVRARDAQIAEVSPLRLRASRPS